MDHKYFVVWGAFVDCFGVGGEEGRWVSDGI